MMITKDMKLQENYNMDISRGEKQMVIKKVDSQFNSIIYFINDDENKYLYITSNGLNTSYKETEKQIKDYITDKIELKERYKDLKEGQQFFGLTKDYPDIKFYSNYFDNFTPYRQESFGLIHLTEDNLSDYLHLIM